MVWFFGCEGVLTFQANLEVVEDFQLVIVFLVIGTNDLCESSVTATFHQIRDFTDTLLYLYGVDRVTVSKANYSSTAHVPFGNPVNLNVQQQSAQPGFV